MYVWDDPRCRVRGEEMIIIGGSREKNIGYQREFLVCKPFRPEWGISMTRVHEEVSAVSAILPFASPHPPMNADLWGFMQRDHTRSFESQISFLLGRIRLRSWSV